MLTRKRISVHARDIYYELSCQEDKVCRVEYKPHSCGRTSTEKKYMHQKSQREPSS